MLLDERQFGTRLWMARLEIFGRLFPWVDKAIRNLARLSPDAKIGIGGTDEDNRAYLVAHAEYANGYGSDRPEVRAIHDRQNAEWEDLTGLPPLGKISDWHAAAAAAGMQGFPETDVRSLPIGELAKIILLWAQAKQSARQAATPATGPQAVQTEQTTAAELIGMVSPDAAQIMLIAQDESKTAEERARLIVALDRQCAGWSSERWGKLLGVKPQAMRKTEFWKKDLRAPR